MGGEEDNEDTDSLLDDEYAALAARRPPSAHAARQTEEEMRWMAQWDKLSGRYFFEDRENPGKPSWEPPEMWADAFETLPEIAQLLRTSPEEHKAAVTVVRFLKHVIFKKEMARSLRRGPAAGGAAESGGGARGGDGRRSRRPEEASGGASTRSTRSRRSFRSTWTRRRGDSTTFCSPTASTRSWRAPGTSPTSLRRCSRRRASAPRGSPSRPPSAGSRRSCSARSGPCSSASACGSTRRASRRSAGEWARPR